MKTLTFTMLSYNKIIFSEVKGHAVVCSPAPTQLDSNLMERVK